MFLGTWLAQLHRDFDASGPKKTIIIIIIIIPWIVITSDMCLSLIKYTLHLKV
jgi:hypothetical protein